MCKHPILHSSNWEFICLRILHNWIPSNCLTQWHYVSAWLSCYSSGLQVRNKVVELSSIFGTLSSKSRLTLQCIAGGALQFWRLRLDVKAPMHYSKREILQVSLPSISRQNWSFTSWHFISMHKSGAVFTHKIQYNIIYIYILPFMKTS